MYEITLITGEKIWMNERIIQKIECNADGTFTLYHFNNTSIQIKYFSARA
jgi:uncharacterized protein YlzI (FlbEa/FlbD family)